MRYGTDTVRIFVRLGTLQLVTRPSEAHEEVPEDLRDLVSRGILTLGEPNDPSVYPKLDPIAPEGTAQALIDEDRG